MYKMAYAKERNNSLKWIDTEKEYEDSFAEAFKKARDDIDEYIFLLICLNKTFPKCRTIE